MVKAKYITKDRIQEVAEFLKYSITWLLEQDKHNDGGCCHYNLDNDLAIYCGWEEGYEKSEYIYTSKETDRSDEYYWAICAGVKIRNDSDCADYNFLCFPWVKDTGDVCDNNITLDAKATNRDQEARFLLESYVDLRNDINKGTVVLDYDECTF